MRLVCSSHIFLWWLSFVQCNAFGSFCWLHGDNPGQSESTRIRSAEYYIRRKPAYPSRLLLREKVTVQDLVPESAIDTLVVQIVQRLDLPVPEPVITFVVAQLLGKIGSDISESSMDRFQEAIQAQETATSFDNVSMEELASLATQMAEELNPKIDIPILNEEQELEILQQILQVLLLILITNEQDRRDSVWSEVLNDDNRNFAQDLLTPQGRKELVGALNAAMDIPILNEDQEEAILYAAVESVALVLTRLLPSSFVQAIQGESPAGLAQTKEFIVNQVNSNVDLIGLSEAQERDLIELFVDVLVDTYVDQTPVGILLLSSEEQSSHWNDRMSLLSSDIQRSQRRYRREQFNLSMQRNRIEKRLAETTKKSKRLSPDLKSPEDVRARESE